MTPDATSHAEPRARGVVPPTPTPEGAQRSILGLLAPRIHQPTKQLFFGDDQILTPLATEAPRGGLIPPPDHGGLPESFPWPASTLAPAPDSRGPAVTQIRRHHQTEDGDK